MRISHVILIFRFGTSVGAADLPALCLHIHTHGSLILCQSPHVSFTPFPSSHPSHHSKSTRMPTVFPFLSLPRELQFLVMSYITCHTDLRSLCLVSKEIAEISTPSLYHDLTLIDQEPTLLARLKSLMISGKGIRSVRTLTTGICCWEAAMLLGQLLSRLRPDFLIRFSFYPQGGSNYFPSAQQLQYVFLHQGRIQNLIFSELEMLPILTDFQLKHKDRPRFLDAITELELKCGFGNLSSLYHSPLGWIDISRLQKLRIIGWHRASYVTKSNWLLLDYSLPRLTHLTLSQVQFFRKVELNNCPSLTHLVVYYCINLESGFTIDSNLALKSLRFHSDHPSGLAQLLNHCRGLEMLEVHTRNGVGPYYITAEMANAIEMHKETLDLLVLDDRSPGYDWNNLFFDPTIFEVVKTCNKLSRLALPLQVQYSFDRWKELVTHLPNLVAMVIYGPFPARGPWLQDPTLENTLRNLAPSSKLVWLCFRYNLLLGSISRCFLRRGLQGMPGKAHADVFVELLFNRENDLFYDSKSMRNQFHDDVARRAQLHRWTRM